MRLHTYDWRESTQQAGQLFAPFKGKYSTFRVNPSFTYYLTDDRAPLHREGYYTGDNHRNQNIPLLGVKVEQFFTPRSYRGLEVSGAGGGGADGYAAILASLGHITPLSPSIQWDNKATVGMAGDGRLDTGGGLMAQFASGFNLSLTDHWYLKAMVGRLMAVDGNMRATIIDLGVGWQAKKPLASAGSRGLFSSQRFFNVPWTTSLSNKTYLPTEHSLNKSGNPYDAELELFGFVMSHPLNDWLALSCSTHWAYAGNIGSYAEGLMGLTLSPSLDGNKHWRAKFAYEAGVAGGGVMDIDGGVIHQINSGVLYQFSQQLSADLSVGRMESKAATFSANVIQLQLNWHHNSIFKR
jgi:hypothetical protein